MIRIEHTEEGPRGLFIAYEGEVEAGIMSYTWAGDAKIIIDHTIVHSAFSGKGIGKQLVLEAVTFARDQGIKIVPLCSFAAQFFEKTPEIQDVLF